ncbi:LysR family transcriptional regulator [Pseudomonas sp. 1239]|nr:LysR family transcriptional regulator [Pseudomonas sp. 1239]
MKTERTRLPFETSLSRRLASRLKMKHLLVLQAIQAHGSLTQVALRLSTSQPAITQILADLESLFSAPLFVRSPRGMLPTELGNLIVARSRGMLADLDHWAMDIEAMTQGRAAHLNVGVIPFLPGRLLATAINQTRSCGKRISVTLHEGSSAHLLERLQAHELDCVIGRTSALPDVPDLQHEVLYHQEPRLIAHERLAMHLNQRPLDLQALARLDWVLGPRQTPIREQLIDFFLNAGITPPSPMVESLSSRFIGELVATNEQAVAIVPADVAEELVRLCNVGRVRHRLGWRLSPMSLFQRINGANAVEQALFARALKRAAKVAVLSTSPVNEQWLVTTE